MALPCMLRLSRMTSTRLPGPCPQHTTSFSCTLAQKLRKHGKFEGGDKSTGDAAPGRLPCQGQRGCLLHLRDGQALARLQALSLMAGRTATLPSGLQPSPAAAQVHVVELGLVRLAWHSRLFGDGMTSELALEQVLRAGCNTCACGSPWVYVGQAAASRGWGPGRPSVLVRAADSGDAAGLVRLYRSQALLQDRCCAWRSDAPAMVALTRSAASSTGACSHTSKLKAKFSADSSP